MDNKIFNFLYNLSNVSWIEDLAFFFSYVFIYILILALIYFVLFRANRKIFAFIFLFLTGLITLAISEFLKMVFVKNRPFIELDLIPIYHENTFSFPSSHTALFFALATVLIFLNKKWAYFFFFFAILIGLSRIVLGVHYPIDVLGGIFLGVFVGLIFSKIFKKI